MTRVSAEGRVQELKESLFFCDRKFVAFFNINVELGRKTPVTTLETILESTGEPSRAIFSPLYLRAYACVGICSTENIRLCESILKTSVYISETPEQTQGGGARKLAERVSRQKLSVRGNASS